MSIVLNKIFWAFRKNFFRPPSPRPAPTLAPYCSYLPPPFPPLPMALGKSASPPDIFPGGG